MTDYLVVDNFTSDQFDDPYICEIMPAECDFFKQLETGRSDHYRLITEFSLHSSTLSAAIEIFICKSRDPNLRKDSMNEFRSGFIAIIGRPNVGKSTLVNALLGQKIAAVSPKPQTTRKRQLGILTTESAQLVFVDTPGMHSPRHKLGRFLNQEAEESLEGVDVILWLVDASARPTDDDKQIASLLNHTPRRTPLVLAANKMDLVPAET